MKFITHTRAAVVAGLLALATAAAGTAALTVGPATAGTGIPYRAASLGNSQLFNVATTSARNA